MPVILENKKMEKREVKLNSKTYVPYSELTKINSKDLDRAKKILETLRENRTKNKYI